MTNLIIASAIGVVKRETSTGINPALFSSFHFSCQPRHSNPYFVKTQVKPCTHAACVQIKLIDRARQGRPDGRGCQRTCLLVTTVHRLTSHNAALIVIAGSISSLHINLRAEILTLNKNDQRRPTTRSMYAQNV